MYKKKLIMISILNLISDGGIKLIERIQSKFFSMNGNYSSAITNSIRRYSMNLRFWMKFILALNQSGTKKYKQEFEICPTQTSIVKGHPLTLRSCGRMTPFICNPSKYIGTGLHKYRCFSTHIFVQA